MTRGVLPRRAASRRILSTSWRRKSYGQEQGKHLGVGKRQDHVIVPYFLVCCLRYGLGVKDKVDINEVINSLDHGLPNFLSRQSVVQTLYLVFQVPGNTAMVSGGFGPFQSHYKMVQWNSIVKKN